MTEFSKLNYINIGPHGTFQPSGALHTTAADIDALFEHLADTDAKKLAVHFHGGLVRESAGEAVARSMQEVFEAGGAHALTFIWETGLIETITRNLIRIGDTKLFQKLLRYVFRQLTKRLGFDVSGRGPGEPMTFAEIEAELAKAEKFEVFDARARGGVTALNEADLEYARNQMEIELLLELQADEDFQNAEENLLDEATHVSPEVEQDLSAGGGRGLELIKVAKHLALVTYQVLRRYWKGRDHGLYPTTVEEILREFYLADFGAWTWGSMKDVAEQMWHPNDGPLDDDAHPGRYFLEKLVAHQAAHRDFKVDLIGHSAGSIAICHMFRAGAAAGKLPKVRNLIFLAPACTIKLMHDEIVAPQARYEGFRMFTMDDEIEQQDHLVKGLYTRSLLYFISGVLEPEEVDMPIAGMTRFWSGNDPFQAEYLIKTAGFLNEKEKGRSSRSVLDDGDDGFNTTSRKHGDFDNDPATRASLTYIINSAGVADAVT